jgi:sec-independent protein translocase protein TatA
MGLDNPIHIAFLVVILLLLFGAKRLPEIGRSLGTGMREFKDSISGASSPTSATPQQPALSQASVPPVAAPVVQQPAPVAAQPVVAQPQPVVVAPQPEPAQVAPPASPVSEG